MSNTKISNKIFEFNNSDYYRNNAEFIQLGDYGRKKGLWVGRLNPFDRLDVSNLSFRTIRGLKIDWKQDTNFDAGLDLSNVVVARLQIEPKIEASVKNFKKGEIELFGLHVVAGRLKNRIEKDEDAKSFFMRYQDSARVVTKAFFIVSAKLSSKLESNAELSVAAGNLLSLGVGVGSSDETNVTLGEGATFAYELSQPIWDGEKVVDMDIDQAGGWR